MRKSAFLLAVLFLGKIGQAQQVVDLEEGKPYSYNGLEYGYYISNESSKEVKGEDYERYEINLTVTNTSGCLKLIPFKAGWNSSGSTSSEDNFMIAEFNCTNATGKRLTAKKGTVSAKPWYSNVRIPDESVKDKYKTINAQVGYALRNGQAATSRIIVLVPKGERPKLNCRVVYLPEVQ
ncbi:MAG: ABC transporter permease [Bacteroidota bacterium]|nr:ABC transporter permease [Bacteroidota bacterium]